MNRMSALKSVIKSIAGKGDFESIYDELERIYSSILTYTSKNEMKPSLAALIPKLRELEKREDAKNKKKLQSLQLLFLVISYLDSQTYSRYFELEEQFRMLNSANKGETLEKARELIQRALNEMKIRFDAEHRLINLQMRSAQGLGTEAQEAAKINIYRTAGVKQGGPYSMENRKKLSKVLARKKMGLALNGSQNAGLEDILNVESSIFTAKMMPAVPRGIPRTSGGKTRRNRKSRRQTRRNHK